jgi:hypothetical protein
MKIQDHQPHFVYLPTQLLLPYAITARKTNKTNSAALAHDFHSDRNLKLRPVFTNYRNVTRASAARLRLQQHSKSPAIRQAVGLDKGLE